MSRRKFFVLAAGGATAALFARNSADRQPPRTNPQIPIPEYTPGPIDRLRNAGLEDYEGVYEAYSEFSGKYGPEFYQWSASSEFSVVSQLTSILDAVAKDAGGPFTRYSIDFWKNGWETDKRTAVEEAQEHVDTLTFSASSEYDLAHLRHTAQVAASLFPALGSALPDKFGDQKEAGGVYTGSSIEVHSDTYEKINTFYYTIHEGLHAVFLQSLPQIKKYLNPREFANYMQTYIRAAGVSMDEWTRLDLSTAMKLFTLNDLDKNAEAAQGTVDQMESIVADWEAVLPEDVLTNDDSIAKTSNPRDKLIRRYNQIAHGVMRTIRHLHSSDPKHPFLSDDRVKDFVRRIGTDMAHRLLFDNAKLVDSEKDIIHSEHFKVWQAFRAAFAADGVPTRSEQVIREAKIRLWEKTLEGYRAFGLTPVETDIPDAIKRTNALLKLPQSLNNRDSVLYAHFDPDVKLPWMQERHMLVSLPLNTHPVSGSISTIHIKDEGQALRNQIASLQVSDGTTITLPNITSEGEIFDDSTYYYSNPDATRIELVSVSTTESLEQSTPVPFAYQTIDAADSLTDVSLEVFVNRLRIFYPPSAMPNQTAMLILPWLGSSGPERLVVNTASGSYTLPELFPSFFTNINNMPVPTNEIAPNTWATEFGRSQWGIILSPEDSAKFRELIANRKTHFTNNYARITAGHINLETSVEADTGRVNFPVVSLIAPAI